MSKIVYYLYFLARALSKINIPILPKIIQVLTRLVFGCYIPYTAQIGKNTVLGYGGLGIVIHARCVIGENCVIGPGVTLGGTSHNYEVPKLGNNVLVGAGAKLLGPINIGNNVVIGANAVVTKDILDNTLVAGVPARVLKEDININDYI